MPPWQVNVDFVNTHMCNFDAWLVIFHLYGLSGDGREGDWPCHVCLLQQGQWELSQIKRTSWQRYPCLFHLWLPYRENEEKVEIAIPDPSNPSNPPSEVPFVLSSFSLSQSHSLYFQSLTSPWFTDQLYMERNFCQWSDYIICICL